MTEDDRTLSEAHAREVWRRAAELQADAARRLEERTRLLAAGPDGAAHPDGYTPDEVRAAAVEAGIQLEHVTRALAETRSADWMDTAITPAQDRGATRILGFDERRLERTRIIAAPPRTVVEALQRVVPAHPYYLRLRDTLGDDPMDGAPLVFAAPEYSATSMGSFAYHAYALDIKYVTLTLRPAPDGAATELSVSADLRRTARRGYKATLWAAGITGVGGGASVGAVAAAALAMGALSVAPAVAGFALTGWGTAKLMGVAYRYSLRKMGEQFDELLRTVDVHARTGGAFPPPILPPRGDDMNAAIYGTVVP